MKVIIAEKPSVAKGIGQVVGAYQKQGDGRFGYYEGNGYQVTWCFGHLLTLFDAEDYNDIYKKWELGTLPIIPPKFKCKLIARDGVKEQFGYIKKLITSSSCDEIIEATDAGREGELIFRLVYGASGCTKPFKRLWISSLEESAIREGMRHLKPGSDYDDLYQSAISRQRADWLIGINGTRLYSAIYNSKLTGGRVQTPTLDLVVTRWLEIQNFKPVPYYMLTADLGGFEAKHKEETSERADACYKACKGGQAKTIKAETKTCKTTPDKLYDITTLQRDANKYFGYTAKETLDYAQALYEAKLATYPRTNSRYLTSAQKNSTRALIDDLVSKGCYAGLSSLNAEPNIDRVINDAKVDDHHALLPTLEVTPSKIAGLAEQQRNILLLIMWRLLVATGPAHTYESTSAEFDINGYIFTAKGKKVLDAGFYAYQMRLFQALGKAGIIKENILPAISVGQVFPVVDLTKEELFTTPPAVYTEDTLLAAMETCGKQVEDEELREAMKEKGLGTAATRANIIEGLVKTGYIERKKKQLIPTEKGISFIKIVHPKLKSAELTGEWEYKLAKIEKGEMSSADFMGEIEAFLNTLIADEKQKAQERVNSAAGDNKALAALSGLNVIGTCPKCGKPVVERKVGYGCTAGQGVCDFIIWKTIGSRQYPKTLTAAQAKKLLATGMTDKINDIMGKSGKPFSAKLKLKDDYSGVEFVFDNDGRNNKSGWKKK
jgi:DNA topoisomerase-3